jgi:glycosyltransferase involved in cell wall biosynthesis
VNQFHAGSAFGDAITGDMLEIQRALRAAGFESKIFCDHIAPEMESKISLLSSYAGDASSLLIVHHSMGFDSFARVVSLPDRRVLRYHNITPTQYLPNSSLRTYAEKGLEQTREYIPHVELAIGVSEYNRQELASFGFRYTTSLPILFRPETLLELEPDRSLARKLRRTFNLLFVGRICANKKQDDLVRIFERYHNLRDRKAHLILVGSYLGTEEYAQQVRSEIAARGLDRIVSLTGKVSSSQLATYYRSSDVFLCASEHEGFCVPLLEAMAFHVPVVGYRSSAIPETLGTAGVLLDGKDPELWCEVIHELRHNRDFHEAVLKAQRERLTEFHVDRTSAKLREIINSLASAPYPISSIRPTLQIQGPFETSYSLAAVNRNLALALDDEGSFDVSIFCTEGPGDYTPDEKNLVDKPRARWLWQKSKMLSAQPDIVIRNLYPPRVHDVQGKANFLYFFWEDSQVSKEWVANFNRSLTGVLAPSRHVEKALRDSGLTVPIHVLHPGVEERFFHPRKPGRQLTKKSFVFLHVSSGFPRKGVDLLLEAYFSGFSASDDVCLIIKTFPNVHNEVARQLTDWQATSSTPPECIHIDKDIGEEEIHELYGLADCLVYPSRAEGLGLPIAEAMASRVPVIVTAYSGHMDFCNEQNAFLIRYSGAPSKSHFSVPGAMWAEPEVAHLREQLRLVYKNHGARLVRERIEAAHSTMEANFHWTSAASRCAEILSAPRGSRPSLAPRLGMVTTWDARCGIAEYSRHLLEGMVRKCPEIEVQVLSPPGEGVWEKTPFANRVCWKPRLEGNLELLRQFVRTSNLDTIHFQFNFGFFDLGDFARTILELKRLGKKVIVTLHRTADLQEHGKHISLGQMAQELSRADLLLVHSKIDQERLRSQGLEQNVRILPHGNIVFPFEDRTLRKDWKLPFNPVIGTFGFLLPHKGVLELLEAFGLLHSDFPNLGLIAQCALHQDGISREFERTVRKRIKELGCSSSVLLSTRLLPAEEAALFLQLSDVVVLPYKETAESTSSAVRFALASGRPVITSSSAIFSDVAEVIYQVPSNKPQDIAAAVKDVLRNPELAEQLAERSRQHATSTSWDRIGALYSEWVASL